MSDRYPHKPSATDLLHDLARIFQSGTGFSRTHTAPQGPIERIFGAVEEFKSSPDWDAENVDDNMDCFAHAERDAWREVCHELASLGIDVNDKSKHDVLVKLIEMWGEKLARVRVRQTTSERDRAFGAREGSLQIAIVQNEAI